MNQVIIDFLNFGPLRLISRLLMGLRGLWIVISLAPAELGSYTIWLLFILYFSMLDLGVLSGLERDLPHHRGADDPKARQEAADTGWSTFCGLSIGSSLLLGLATFFVFKDFSITLLLTGYLISDKIYRAYDANSRISFLYRENGIGELILAVVSLALIWVLIPIWGVDGIFVGFIAGSLASACYLWSRAKIDFCWTWNIKRSWEYILRSFPLALVNYSVEFFHAVALTILAYQWDKETLGYFAFAHRMFYMALTLFPYAIREVFRTRMYFQAARPGSGKGALDSFYLPMNVYCAAAAFIWLTVYWWIDPFVYWAAPVYTPSTLALKLLMLAFVPLGITKILTDYLCSNVNKRTMAVIMAWGVGIILQTGLILGADLDPANILYKVPGVYLLSTLVVYIWIGITSFRLVDEVMKNMWRLVYFLLPLAIAVGVAFLGKQWFLWSPQYSFSENLAPFFLSVLATFLLSCGAYSLFVFLNRK